jgi:hypothetical protein
LPVKPVLIRCIISPNYLKRRMDSRQNFTGALI